MKKFRKKFMAILTALLLVVLPTELRAASVDPGYDVMPCWEYMHGITLGLNFDGTDGFADISVTPLTGITTYLEGTLSVYRRTGGDWTLVASASNSSSNVLFIDVEFNAVYGQTYKAEATVTAYGDNGSETDTVSNQANCPKAEDS